jgi:hypothetical protein
MRGLFFFWSMSGHSGDFIQEITHPIFRPVIAL